MWDQGSRWVGGREGWRAARAAHEAVVGLGSLICLWSVGLSYRFSGLHVEGATPGLLTLWSQLHMQG